MSSAFFEVLVAHAICVLRTATDMLVEWSEMGQEKQTCPGVDAGLQAGELPCHL